MSKINPKILIVEDEPDVCSSLHSYFGRRGYQVSSTASGLEALTLLKVARSDVIILDFALNDLNGQEVLKKLRRHDKKTKVIVITGQLLPAEEVEKIHKLGITAYLTKPVVLERLGELIGLAAGGKVKPSSAKTAKRKKTLMGADAPAEEVSGRAIFHKLSNLLGIVRNKCESFTLNLDEGIYRDKSDKEVIGISAGIMKDIIHTVDKAMEEAGKIKQDK